MKNITKNTCPGIILLSLIIAQLFVIPGTAYSEIIYTTDGNIIEAKISEKTDDAIWYEVETGDIVEEVCISISDIDRILNDDKSVSEYSPIRTD
jgi:hypothetical protein